MGTGPGGEGGSGVKERKEARPGIAVPKRAAETGTACETASSSANYHTTAAEGRQIKISDYLAHGAEHAVPRRHLRQMTGLSDRDLRRRNELERREGSAICSDNLTGYYLAADDEERKRFVNSMLHRAAEIARTAAAIEGADIDWI